MAVHAQWKPRIIRGDCLKVLQSGKIKNVDLTFLDPPFNQGKAYRHFNDQQSPGEYWAWMGKVVKAVYDRTGEGGAIYFMHREKNADRVLKSLAEAGWTYQNLIIWKKHASPAPMAAMFGKQYQVIVYAIKGKKPRVFNRLRIDYPLMPWQKLPRKNGIFVTDVWDDIRELTSGYFAGDEALKGADGGRLHEQQSPVELLLRIILTSTLPVDHVFDPFAGTGTSLVVAERLGRKSTGVEIDPKNVAATKRRFTMRRKSDDVLPSRNYYRFTENIDGIWSLLPPEMDRCLPQKT